jgi:outer membrane receptor protein involved in Fe transport
MFNINGIVDQLQWRHRLSGDSRRSLVANNENLRTADGLLRVKQGIEYMRRRTLRWSRGWVMRPDGLVLAAERRQSTSFWVPVCLILAQCVSSGAYARQSRDSSTLDHQSASLEEIVVTAEKRSSTVQTTPVSITAITGEDLRSMGVSSAQGLAAEVPGLAISSSGPGQAQYEIRGMTADAGEASTIGFYLDEIPITPPTTATNGKVAIDPDLYDLARVEVLRGPQGTLYGAGSMGGTVKLVTTPPDPRGFY